jgi:hypothetical protein
MKQFHSNRDTERYEFDFGECSYKNGWAQLDTLQDASYYGNWLNPDKRAHFSFAEGDCTLTFCDSDAEFAEYVRNLVAWHNDNGYGPALIDAMMDGTIKAEFERIGLADLLH